MKGHFIALNPKKAFLASFLVGGETFYVVAANRNTLTKATESIGLPTDQTFKAIMHAPAENFTPANGPTEPDEPLQ